MTLILDNQTFILNKLKDGEPRRLRELHVMEYKGKVIQAMSWHAANQAISKLKKRGQVERVSERSPALYCITTAGLAVLQRRDLLEQVDTKALLRSLKKG